jgi:hypothetical protein
LCSSEYRGLVELTCHREVRPQLSDLKFSCRDCRLTSFKISICRFRWVSQAQKAVATLHVKAETLLGFGNKLLDDGSGPRCHSNRPIKAGLVNIAPTRSEMAENTLNIALLEYGFNVARIEWKKDNPSFGGGEPTTPTQPQRVA